MLQLGIGIFFTRNIDVKRSISKVINNLLQRKLHFTTNEYAKMVINNCFLCAANRPRHKTTRPDYPNKILVTIEQPGIFWYTDTIQIVSIKTSDTNSLLTFADGFSAFVVAVPYSDPMTNEKFLSIFQLHVLTIFPQTKYILSDNAQNISSNVIKQYLHNLNIQMINSRPYSAKSNIAEGLQRLLLRSIRLGAQEVALEPHDWHKILHLLYKRSI